MDLNNLYKELIVDHGACPRNFKALCSANCKATGHNFLCGDLVNIYIYIEKNYIKDITFTGNGCAISTASASLMTEAVKYKSLKEWKIMFKQFYHLLTTNKQNISNNLGKLNALAGIRKYPSRIKCATLAWHTLQDACNKYT